MSYRSTLGLAALAITCINVLALYHMPLPWSGEGYDLAPNFVMGFTISLVLAVIFITSYVYRVAQETRRLSDALAAAQAALDREQSLSSLGALAAAAAHELGSPLGTISLVSRELQREIEADDPIRADIDLLVSQSARCREILAELSRRPEEQQARPLQRHAGALVDRARGGNRTAGRKSCSGSRSMPIPPIRSRRCCRAGRSSSTVLGNLLQNAIEFAREEVKVTIAWNAAEISITISDDGKGFPRELLDRLGDPYLSSGADLRRRRAQGRPYGARHLHRPATDRAVRRRGEFRQQFFCGAEVISIWPRSASKEHPNMSETALSAGSAKRGEDAADRR